MAEEQLPVLDVHHHLWDMDVHGHHYEWLNALKEGEKLAPLKASYLYPELLRDFEGCNVVKSVHVQGEWRGDPVGETKWLSEVADSHAEGFPHAIVGHVDLGAPDAEAVLDGHCKYTRFRGVRQLLNWHDLDESLRAADRDFLSDPTWRDRVGLLKSRGLIFELHLYQHQMAQAAELAAQHPDVPFVLDHVGCPYRRDDAGYDDWLASMKVLAKQPNVYCKISGLIHPQFTAPGEWSAESLERWVAGALSVFGAERCMYGSNFPVDGVCGSYKDILAAVKHLFSKLQVSNAQQRAIFYGNAAKLYLREEN